MAIDWNEEAKRASHNARSCDEWMGAEGQTEIGAMLMIVEELAEQRRALCLGMLELRSLGEAICEELVNVAMDVRGLQGQKR